jgi:hypothetical protein
MFLFAQPKSSPVEDSKFWIADRIGALFAGPRGCAVLTIGMA